MIEKAVPILPPPGVIRRGSKFATGMLGWFDTNWVRWMNGAVVARESWSQITSTALTFIPHYILPLWDVAHPGLIVHEETYGGQGDVCHLDSSMVRTRLSAAVTGSLGVNSYIGLAPPAWFGVGATRYALWIMGKQGLLKQWQNTFPVTVDSATTVANSPTGNSVFVTPERFVVVLAADSQEQTIAWASQGTLTTWAASSSNTAGNYTLGTTGVLVRGSASRLESLLWTTNDLWVMSYVGGTAVYNFHKAGDNCGALGGQSITQLGDTFFWMDRAGQCFMYDGVVRPLPMDDVREGFLDMLQALGDINPGEETAAFADPLHNEVTWFFGLNGNANSRGITFHVSQGKWSLTQFGVSGVWSGTSPGQQRAIAASASTKHLYQLSNIGNDTGLTGLAYAETGPLQIGQGENVARLQKIIVDNETADHCTLTIFAGTRPLVAESSTAVTVAAGETDVRLTGRYFRFKWTQKANTPMRLGGAQAGIIVGGSR